MREKMEELVIEPKTMSMDAEWSELVNSRADKAEEERQRRMSWAEKQRATHMAQTHRVLNAVAAGLGMIAAGGIFLNDSAFPLWVGASLAMGGAAILVFVMGWLFGHKGAQ